MNRKDNQLTTSPEGKPGPTPAEKTLPHFYPKTQVPKGEGTKFYLDSKDQNQSSQTRSRKGERNTNGLDGNDFNLSDVSGYDSGSLNEEPQNSDERPGIQQMTIYSAL